MTKAAGLALAASLLLPWFSGTDDGEPLTIAGWDTEPGFTVGMLACALVIAVARRPLVVALAAVVAIALTIWMLPRGDRYSGYDLAAGGVRRARHRRGRARHGDPASARVGSSGVRFGLMTFPTDFSIAPAELGRAAEDAGFETLLFAEHTHIPVARDTPNPRGGELPEKYWHTHDPFVALATVAQATTKLRFGTGICLVVERDPITTAKEVASLDFLSGGRFEFGVGGGWNREEMANHGTDPKRRFALMRERILAMKEIWTNDEAEFHGEFVDFEPIWSWPKPVQQPHPPVLMGGIGPKVLDRVLEYGDEWMPNRAEPEELAPRIEELRERAGRHVPVSYYAATPEDDFIERLAAAGVDRALLDVPSEGADTVLPLVERYAELAARHR